MRKSPGLSHLSLLRAPLRQPDPEARGYLLDLLRIIRMFLKVRQVLVGSRRHPQAATIYDTSAPVADRQTPSAIPSIPLSERRIRVLDSPPRRLPSTK